jgi:hypothetical protein
MFTFLWPGVTLYGIFHLTIYSPKVIQTVPLFVMGFIDQALHSACWIPIS